MNEEADCAVVRQARSLAELVAGWDDLVPQVSEAELARDIREGRDARSRSL